MFAVGFSVGMERERLKESTIRGRYQKAAVGCWFTSTGKAIPMLVKYEDKDGFRHMIRHIQILRTEKKYYAGILGQRYDCSTVINGKKQEFILFYRQETNTWDMILPE